MIREAPVWRFHALNLPATLVGTLRYDDSAQLWSFQFERGYLDRSDSLELDPFWVRRLSASAFKGFKSI